MAGAIGNQLGKAGLGGALDAHRASGSPYVWPVKWPVMRTGKLVSRPPPAIAREVLGSAVVQSSGSKGLSLPHLGTTRWGF